MDIVIRAALAPADPSSQDMAVARQAQTERSKAQVELSKKREAERSQGKDEESGPTNAEGANSTEDSNSNQQDGIAAYQRAAGAEAAASIFAIIQSA